MKSDKNGVNKKCCENCLSYSYEDGLFSGAFKRRKSEFVSDRKRDKTECDI